MVGAGVEGGLFPKSMLKFVLSFNECSNSNKGVEVLNTIILNSDGTLVKEINLLIRRSSVQPLAPLSFHYSSP